MARTIQPITKSITSPVLLPAGGSFRRDRVARLPNVAPAIAFNNASIWTIAGTGASSTASSFGASGSVVGALAATPPLVNAARYFYLIEYTITAGDLQIINGTGTSPVIAQQTGSGTMRGYFTASNTNFRLRTSAIATVTVTKLELKRIP